MVCEFNSRARVSICTAIVKHDVRPHGTDHEMFDVRHAFHVTKVMLVITVCFFLFRSVFVFVYQIIGL